MNAVKTCSLVVAISALFAGCSSTPVAPETPATPPVVTPAVQTTTQSSTPAETRAVTPTTSTTASAVTALPAHLDPASRISTERSVYFDFDKFDIRSEFTALIEAHGKYLASTSGVAIKVEGHADERGSKEYNLALGQKRAASVVNALKAFGVKDSQAEPVSFGEEKPKATGSGEAAWSQNRRVDLAYPAK